MEERKSILEEILGSEFQTATTYKGAAVPLPKNGEVAQDYMNRVIDFRVKADDAERVEARKAAQRKSPARPPFASIEKAVQAFAKANFGRSRTEAFERWTEGDYEPTNARWFERGINVELGDASMTAVLSANESHPELTVVEIKSASGPRWSVAFTASRKATRQRKFIGAFITKIELADPADAPSVVNWLNAH